MSESYGQLEFTKDELKDIKSLHSKIDSSNEFEVMFYNFNNKSIDAQKFLKMLEYMNKRRKLFPSQKLVKETTLDVIFSENLTSYRITIKGMEKIHEYLTYIHKRKNHVIYKVLLNKMIYGDNSITLIKKVKNMDNIKDIPNYDIRFRLSDEVEPTKKEILMLKGLTEKNRFDITFRYKQRASLIIEKTKDTTIRIDLTNIKMTNNVNRIENTVSRYELELEILSDKARAEHIGKLMKEIEILHKVLQQSNFIINNNEEEQVMNAYYNLLSTEKKNASLNARKPISLEILNVLDALPNKYAVTDKADGERYFLIISNKNVYLLSNTLHLKKTGIVLKSNKYDNSILDGEYIFLPKHNRHIFMTFDCLYKSGEDIRNELNFMIRLKHADEVIENCFILGKQKGYKFKDYNGVFSLANLGNYHDKSIDVYMKALNDDIELEKKFPLIRRKYFIDARGGSDNEIFRYSELMWKKYVYDAKTNCPYILDGLMYHPLLQKYVTSVKASKYFEYKWKPADKNSIDFYITFEKNPDTKKELTLFDNSHSNKIKGKPYKICHLHVGKMINGIEKPVLFQKDTQKYISHLFLNNGEVRDIEGNIIQDGTVVEFYYDNNPELNEKHKWVPMRTRYDKTEFVQKYKRRYGNYIDIANKVWRSMINPFTIKDISILANEQKYMSHYKYLRGKIDHSTILSERKENSFYQMIHSMAKPMRNFDNWIRSILIYTYCNQAYEKGYQHKVLDLGCDKGLNTMKYYYGKVNYVVAIDPDNNNLNSAGDGAISRYEKLKETHANFPMMHFINADPTALLNIDDQQKAIGTLQQQHRANIEKFFPKTGKRILFDRINCQFSLQYYLENETTWNNFCKNISDNLKKGGYLMLVAFDGKLIKELLKENNTYTSYYTSKKGERKILLEIKKKYTDNDVDKKIGVGNAIDVHNALKSPEDISVTEYLVDKNFIEKELFKKSDLELIESDLFSNQFHIHEEYFKHVIKYEENEKTREFLKNAGMYYNQEDSVNKACFSITKLMRFYVFRRKETDVKQKGGNIDYDKLENFKYVVDNSDDLYYFNSELTSESSFYESICKILAENEVIPKNITHYELCEDLKIDLATDNGLTKDDISSLAKKLKIGNIVNGKNKTILNGVKLYVVEKDCDSDYTIERFGKLNSKNSMIIYKNGHNYNPVLKKTHEGYIGIFNSKDNDIIHMEKEYL